ncbi:MAG: hypothetical protein ACYTE8_05885, partial [Planctomycetota bacterium]
MVEDKQNIPNRINRPAVKTSETPSLGLTPKEILGILRRHVFLIMFFTTTGLVAGGGSWYLLLRNAPKYTASTFVEVLPPIDRDPMDLRGIIVNKDIQFGYRLSIASLMKQQGVMMELLQQREKIKETNWYLQHGDNMVSRLQGSYRDLEKKLNVVPSREADFIAVSMTCGSGKEAALIVNELVGLFVRNYGATKKSEATEKLSVFVARRDKIQQELEYANTLLKQVSESLPRGFVDL